MNAPVIVVEATPRFVSDFPDLSDADIDAIFNRLPVFEAEEDQAEYDFGWQAWDLHLLPAFLSNLAPQGYLDAEAAYADERTADRQLSNLTALGHERANLLAVQHDGT